MNNGFIKLHRQLIEWEWYDDANTFRLFIHFLLKANFKDKNWRGITVKKGSFITGYDKLSRELKLTKQQIRTGINKLKSTGEITHQSCNKYSIVTLVKYGDYQDRELIEVGKLTHKATHEQQSNNNQITPTKNVKNVKKVKNKIIPYDEIKDLYNKILPELKGANTLDKTRKVKLKESWDLHESHQSLDFWERYFKAVRFNDHAMGRTAKKPPYENWVADFSYIVKAQTLIKITESRS